jgi:predicted nucleotidyltransferase component of viral defense system
MLSFEDIKGHYPAKLQGSLYAQHMIKEYLQTLVLGRISKEIPSGNLTFIGGTSLRFCHGLDRFSEDLDFDFTGDDKEILRGHFSNIIKRIIKEGINCMIEHNYKETDNYCKIVFPDVARKYNLTDPQKKIWIKVDIQQNTTGYKKADHFVNRFGMYYPVTLPAKNILFSMKAVALVSRTKGRDMYDFSFLSDNARLDFKFIKNELKQRGVGISSPEMLKKLILEKAIETDIREKEHEISLFLLEKENKIRITTFIDYIKSLDFNELSKDPTAFLF